MAIRTWVKLLAATLGVAALAGACQLGLAYGLGILRLTRVIDITTRDQWTAQLAWVAWFAMSAAVLGSLAGGRLLDRWGGPATVGGHIGLALAAGAGAAVVVPLTMQPARTAQIAGVDAVFVIGLCAGLGAVAGIFAAYAALTQAIARWSMIAVGAVIGVLAVVSVAPSLAPSDPLPAVRLGVFDAGFLSPATTQRTALFTMPAVALLIGAALGWAARRRELPILTIALAGLPGPALLTVSYLIAGPGSGSDRYQVVPYWAAMTATGAGVLGSVLAAVIRRGGAEGDDEDLAADPGADPGGKPEDTGVIKLPGGLPEPRAASDADSGADTPAILPSGGRRSSAAEAFTGRERPARRPDPEPDPATGGGGAAFGEYPDPETAPFDAFTSANTSSFGSRWSTDPSSTDPLSTGSSSTEPSPGRPRSDLDTATAGLPHAGLPGADLPDIEPRDTGLPHAGLSDTGLPRAGLRDTELPGAGRVEASWAAAAHTPRPDGSPASWPGDDARESRAAAAFQPHVPAPATLPLPPEAIEEPEQTRSGGGLLGRGRLPFGRGKSRATRDTAVPAPPHRSEIPSEAATATWPGRRPLTDTPDPAPEPGYDRFSDGPNRQPSPDGSSSDRFSDGPDRQPSLNSPSYDRLSDGPDRQPSLNSPSYDRPSDRPGHRAPADGQGHPPLPDAAGPVRRSQRAGRGPLVPEPHAISAPLPDPDPITPPLPVTPAPETDTGRRGRAGKRASKDDDYVDWVSGLSGE